MRSLNGVVLKRKPVAGVAFVVLLAVLGGCAAPGHRAIQENPGDLPARAAVEGVPFYPQDAYYCGPASLAMMLTWAGIPITQEEIAGQVYTPGRRGTLPIDLLTGARRNGALAVKVASMRDLLREIAAGHPVLIFQNLGLDWWPQWHFAVAFEYDLGSGTLVLHSGTTERRITDLDAFERTWRRADYWAITVTQPDELPHTADVEAIVGAAAGLERAGQYQAAATAYETILGRWAGNIPALMGLGNVLYVQQKFEAAAGRFRAVIRIDPGYAPAWNNLAYALAGTGHQQEALEAAERAVSLGKDNSNYRDTLREIRAAGDSPG